MFKALVVLCVVPVAASGATPGLQLTWSAPAGCPRQADIEAAIARLISDQQPETDVVASARVEGAWEVVLETEGRTRRLTGATCHSVSEAVVVVLALMIDPLAKIEDPLAPPPPSRQWSLGLWGTVDTHSLPAISPGAALAASVELGAGFDGELQVLGWLPQVKAVGEAGARVTLLTGAIGARRDFFFGPVAIGPVLALELGTQRGSSFGVSNPEVAWAFWAAGRAGLALSVKAGRFRFGVRAEAAVPFVKPSFLVGGVGEVHTAAPITARGAFTIEMLFSPRSR